MHDDGTGATTRTTADGTASPPCPACESAAVRRHHFAEGVIATCTQCTLQWSENLDDAALDGPVKALFHSSYMDPRNFDPTCYRPYDDFFASLQKFFHGPVRLLDIGCGNGAFLGECLRRGHDGWGVEIDQNMERYMAPEVRKRVFFTPVENSPPFEAPFQVITFWDSFEHLPAPFTVLNVLRPHLASDGLVFLRVNNSWDILNLVTLATLKLVPPVGRQLLRACFSFPVHFWNFSYRPIYLMCTREGWHIRHHRITETPAERFTNNLLARALIKIAYFTNRLMGGGKIGEYYLAAEGPHREGEGVQRH